MARFHGLRLERARASAQWRDGAFRNPTGVTPKLDGNPFGVVAEWVAGGRRRRPQGAVPVERPHEAWARPVSADGARITWLGHSTLLLELDGATLLTDPVFGLRASPVGFAGPKRFHAPPATIEELPPLDAVLLSHDHFDHLCAPSVRQLARRGVAWITSLGVGAHLEALGVEATQITELDWWEAHELPGKDVRISAAPAQHFSGRGALDRNATLWSSFVIETPRRRYFFSGDTGLGDHFAQIRERFGPCDVSLLEIGAFHPSWGQIHLGPANALEAHAQLGGGALLPIHWGTFDLALHAYDDPAETLLALAAERGARVLTPRLGRPFDPASTAPPDPWWRNLDRGA